MVLPRCAAGAESAAEAAPPPLGGTWRTPDSPAGQRPAHLVFLRLKLGRRERSGAPPPGFLLPSGPEAATYPTVTWNPGTQVPIRIIVALLPDGPGARCPSAAAAAAVPVSGGGDGQDLTRRRPHPRRALRRALGDAEQLGHGAGGRRGLELGGEEVGGTPQTEAIPVPSAAAAAVAAPAAAAPATAAAPAASMRDLGDRRGVVLRVRRRQSVPGGIAQHSVGLVHQVHLLRLVLVIVIEVGQLALILVGGGMVEGRLQGGEALVYRHLLTHRVHGVFRVTTFAQAFEALIENIPVLAKKTHHSWIRHLLPAHGWLLQTRARELVCASLH